MQWCPQNNAVVAIAWNDTVEILDPSIGFDRCENILAILSIDQVNVILVTI